MKINDWLDLSDEQYEEIFEEDALEFFKGIAFTDADGKGTASRTQIKELFEPIFNLIIEKVAEDQKWTASQIANFDWEED